MTNSSNVTQEYIGTGRRKTAVARIRMTLGSGKVLVNGRPFEEYFNLENIRIHALEPLKRTCLLYTSPSPRD